MSCRAGVVVVLVAAGAWWVDALGTVLAVDQCAQVSARGYCVEWTVSSEGGGGSGGSGEGDGGERPSDEPVCWWESVNIDVEDDPPFLNDYGLSAPPEGVAVTWQTLECSDGVIRDQYRWVQRGPTAAELAQAARGRLADVLPAPVVVASPPRDVAAIVGVPVFVALENWSGSVSESACAGGLCVTVTALPTLWFDPAEPGAAAVACSEGGTLHVEGADPFAEAAVAGACVHQYTMRTGVEGRPAAWLGAVWVEWSLGWSASDGQSGTLPMVVRSTDLPRAVDEVQTVVVGGESP